MKDKIEIKAIYSEWKSVGYRQAKQFVDFLLDNLTAIPENEKIKYINENKIRGITVEKLYENENSILKIMQDKEFLNDLKINSKDIIKAIKTGLKEFKELEEIVKKAHKENKSLQNLCTELGGFNKEFYQKYPNKNYFDLNYKSLLITVVEPITKNEKKEKYELSKTGVYIYPDYITKASIDELVIIDLEKEIDFNYIQKNYKEGEIMRETYSEMKKRHSDEINAFPIGFAFSKEGFKESMEELGLTENDTDKITGIGYGGGFIKKDDVPKFVEMIKRQNKEQKEAIEADKTGEGFIKEMFRYELNNHEYYISGEYDETLESLNLTMEDINNDPKLKRGLELAKKEYLEKCYALEDKMEEEEDSQEV